MKRGGVHYAPDAEVHLCTLNSPDLAALLAWSEVMVYATGSESVASAVSGAVRTFEYRHTPETHSVDTQMLPLIEKL